MKSLKKQGNKIISVILVLLFVLQMIPLQASAHTSAQQMTADTEVSETPEANEPISLLYELPDKRDEYTKVYKKSDNTCTAYISSVPLHQKKNGVWMDIDNTLCPQESDGKAVYTNTDNPLQVTFPQTLSHLDGITMESNGYTLSFTVENIQQSDAVLTSNTASDFADSDIPDTLKVQSETAVYADVFPQTALEYSIHSKSVKENIIIDSPDAVRAEYTFRLQADAVLSAQLSSDGSVQFLSPDGQEAFYLPAPFMKDANNTVSDAIEVSLTELNGEYILTYRPEQAWLKHAERQYPVVLDPMVVLEEDWFTQAAVTSESPDENFCNGSLNIVANGLTVNENGDVIPAQPYAETYVQLHLDKIKVLTEDITPIDVQFVFAGGGTNLAAYEITQALDLQEVTYNTKPMRAAEPTDYYINDSFNDLQAVHFNITKLFNSWLAGEKENNGFAVYAYDNTKPASGIFFSRGSKIGNSFITMDFVESSG